LRWLFQPLGSVAKLVGCFRELVPTQLQSAALFEEGSYLAQKLKKSFVQSATRDALANSRPPSYTRAAEVRVDAA
jgi:hypothetical protein